MKVGAQAAVRLRDADGEQALGVHVAKILEREARLAVVFLGAWREHTPAEAPRLVDEVGLQRRQAKCVGGKNRCVTLMACQRVVVAVALIARKFGIRLRATEIHAAAI